MRAASAPLFAMLVRGFLVLACAVGATAFAPVGHTGASTRSLVRSPVVPETVSLLLSDTLDAANAACSGNNENFCKEFPIAQGLEWGLGLGIYGAFKAGKLPFGMQEYMDGYFGKGATLGVAASRKKAAEAKQGRK